MYLNANNKKYKENQIAVFYVNQFLSECTTKDAAKCEILYDAVSNGTEFNNCSWYENKEIVWCQSIPGDNNELTKYGYCQANCSMKGIQNSNSVY